MRIVILILSILLLIISGIYSVMVYYSSYNRIIHCSSAFDSYVGNESFHAKLTLYLYHEKGNIQIVGDYISSEGKKHPIKSVTGINYRADGGDYHVRFTGNKMSSSSDEISTRFFHLIPFSLTSENIDYIYQILPASEESFIIGQNGIPLILCKKSSSQW